MTLLLSFFCGVASVEERGEEFLIAVARNFRARRSYKQPESNERRKAMLRKFRTKEWAIMMFIANDNNLGEFTKTKISEISSVGSTRASDVIIQFDTPGRSFIRRMRLSKGKQFRLPALQKETNTGDKRTLIRFADLTLQDFHPRRAMLVISNHGTGLGIASDDNTHKFHAMQIDMQTDEVEKGPPLPRRRAPIFWSGANREIGLALLDVGDAPPSDPNDALDLLELKAALQTIVRKHGRLELLAFDACLMGTIEVAYQLRNHARIMVASQSNIPVPGCRFASTFALMRDETMSTANAAISLARDVTPVADDEYSAMAALNLEKADEVAEAISTLADALVVALQSDPDALRNINRAHLRALQFLDSETIDLYQFCEALTSTMRQNERVVEAATDVQELVEDEFVLDKNPRGAVVEGARGISITLPRRNVLSDLYRQLDFARETSWIEFLDVYLKQQYPPLALEDPQLVAPAPPVAPPAEKEILEPVGV